MRAAAPAVVRRRARGARRSSAAGAAPPADQTRAREPSGSRAPALRVRASAGVSAAVTGPLRPLGRRPPRRPRTPSLVEVVGHPVQQSRARRGAAPRPPSRPPPPPPSRRRRRSAAGPWPGRPRSGRPRAGTAGSSARPGPSRAGWCRPTSRAGRGSRTWRAGSGPRPSWPWRTPSCGRGCGCARRGSP